MNSLFKSLLLSTFLLTGACAPQQFTGTSLKASGTNNDLSDDDGQIPIPTPTPRPSPSPTPTPTATPLPTPTPAGPTAPAENYSLSNLCVLTSPDFQTGYATYLPVQNEMACLEYGEAFHRRYQGLYEIEVRYLPKAQVEAIVKAITGVTTITPSTRISLPSFLAAIYAGTTPLIVHPYLF